MSHPYRDLPDHQFWRRGVAGLGPHELDPVVAPRFRIAPHEGVATAGSCFAQHIARRLASIGFRYLVTEDRPELPALERRHRNYGVFTARYGNIYTVRQLLQLFEEAFGRRSAAEPAWLRPDGRFVDPLRPNIEPDGYESPDAVAAARSDHLARVRLLFETADVFVFTLGLTEGWLARDTGEVLPLAPGVVAGAYDPDRYEAVNFDVDAVRADLLCFLALLREVRPTIKVVLTLSPVPLIATFEPRHVLVSTAYSKSVLRIAAEAALQRFDWVDYFPSYEIITGHFNMGRYYEADLREVNALGVNHAMRCFVRHYTEGAAAAGPVQASELAPTADRPGMVCDEESIAKLAG